MIIFTYRELKSAWNNCRTAFESADTKSNAHRLLLFYAVETGLKAVYLKRNNKNDTGCDDAKALFSEIQHNLNKLMHELRTGSELNLPADIQLNDLKLPTTNRRPSSAKLNEIWRYGAIAIRPTDAELENQLIAILAWIDGELR
ncbi:MAG: hypothetical protein HOP34_06075 [Methylococcaceae bacterium]|nr:hypothetical protein [Methylococcaceae bacterium]